MSSLVAPKPSVSVVSFITGRGEDRCVSIVAGFASESEAEGFCRKMNDELRARSLHFDSKNVPDYDDMELFGVKVGHLIHHTGGKFICEMCPFF